jgi:hypothetical protein
MAYNLGTNIGAVENGLPTGQAYATKIIRTYTLSVTLGANAISTNGCVLASDGTDIGYKAIPIVTPYINGTFPRHLTIQNVRLNTNSVGLYGSGVGALIFPQLPTIGVFNRTTCEPFGNTATMNIAYNYLASGSLWQVNTSANSRTGLYVLNQVIGTTAQTNITNLYVVLFLGTTGFTPVAGTIVNIQVDVSFE